MEDYENGTHYRVLRFPHPMYLNWVLNPGIFVVELLLGLRIPRETFVEETDSEDVLETQFAICRSCGQLTNLTEWRRAKCQFGNWFGLACPNCGEKIPTALNIFSLVIVLLLNPLIYWLKQNFEREALLKQAYRLRYHQPLKASKKNIRINKYTWLFFTIVIILLELAWGYMRGLPLPIVFVMPLITGVLINFAMKYFVKKSA